MEAANEAETDRAFGVKNMDAETTLPSSTESSSVGKPNQLSEHKSYGYMSNVLVDVPRVNKGGAIRDNSSLSRAVTSRLPVMRRSASSDAILSSYLYGRWPRLDALNADYYMKIQPRAVHELRLQPRSSAEAVGANSVLDQEAAEEIRVSTSRALSHYVPATKSASWTDCGTSFNDANMSVILTSNRELSGNEPVLSSPLEIEELCNQEIDALVSQTEAMSFEEVDHYANETDGHRAPLADLLNQLSSSSDCCRAMHFVTICDTDDSSSSDSDASNENSSFVVGSFNDESAVTPAAYGASLPAVSVASAGGSSAGVVSGTSAKECCRVRHSPALTDVVNSSPTTSLVRNGHGSTIQSSIAEGHCQHIGTGAKHNVITVKSVCRPAPEGCESKSSVVEQQYKAASIIPSQQSAFVRPRYSTPAALSC